MNQKKVRGFEVIQDYKNKSINLPQRSTYHAAGYDIEAAETCILPSYWKQILHYYLLKFNILKDDTVNDVNDILKPTLIPTGIKAYMKEDEYLQIVNRSSNPIKRRLMIPNGIGIIDQDYYNNENNEGHIFVQMLNFGLRDVKIEKGERIAQGIFSPFFKVDGDEGGVSQRTGGFGSSGHQ